MAKKKALITGILGQDGAYLAKLLLERDYQVYGAARRSASWNSWRLRDLGVEEGVKFEYFDLLEYENMRRLIDRSERRAGRQCNSHEADVGWREHDGCRIDRA